MVKLYCKKIKNDFILQPAINNYTNMRQSHSTQNLSNKTLNLKMKNILILASFITTSVHAQINHFNYNNTKNITVSKAAVVSAHALASNAGIEVMKKGGNAWMHCRPSFILLYGINRKTSGLLFRCQDAAAAGRLQRCQGKRAV